MNNNAYMLIGLTGPTGSGKSTVSRIFKEHGFAVVDADTIAHNALCDKGCKDKLCDTFGADILYEDGSINRKALAACAFKNADSTKKLNAITHPVILSLAKAEFEKLSSQGFSRIIFDAPTLFESGSHTMCDLIISVVAPMKLRLERILSRDNLTTEQALSRINAQQNDSFYTDRSNYVIVNDGDTLSLTKRCEAIIKELEL